MGLAVGVRASCEPAARGAATARADLVPWELPSSEALLRGLAGAAAPARRSPACPWLRAAGPDLPALPSALAGGGGMGLIGKDSHCPCGHHARLPASLANP